jgi:hypothetical protein
VWKFHKSQGRYGMRQVFASSLLHSSSAPSYSPSLLCWSSPLSSSSLLPFAAFNQIE